MTTPVKILLVEDELLIAEEIRHSLEQAGYVVVHATNEPDALKLLASDVPDLVIMDIRIEGEKDGIDTVISIKKEVDLPVIYLTDFDDEKTMKRAKETHPSGYLLKPFNKRQLLASIETALYNYMQGKDADSSKPNTASDNHYVLNNCIFIKENSGYLTKVPFGDITHIEAGRAYSDIYTVHGKKYTQSFSMNYVHSKLAQPFFVRVHRSFVINLDHVKGIKGNQLVVGEKEITVGELFKADVMKRFPTLK